jgi:copper transport protein
MAVWLGGLMMLAGFLLRQADERELGAILPVWSRWAATAVAALLLAGTTQALIEVGTLDALFSTTYGRLVLTKVGLFAVVLAVAAYSRQLVRRRTAAGRPGRMRQAVIAELVVTVVVLAVSATLVQTTPARTVAADTAAGVGYFNATLTSPVYALRVVVDPARAGNNSVHLDVFTPDNQQPKEVVEWRATAALPSAGVEPIEVPLLPLTANHATGEINLPTPGEWEFRFVVRTSEIDQATVTTTVPIG